MRNWTTNNAALYHADCRKILPTIPSESIHAAILDPPYPCIERNYGTWTEDEWFALMQAVVRELKRILTPTGSAVIVLQPNSEHIGSMRPWLWDFLSWVCKEWNVIQDVYWFNHATVPTAHCSRKYGLMRPAVKTCMWLGSPKAYRNQDAVLIPLGKSTRRALANGRAADDTLRYSPSGQGIRFGRAVRTAEQRGGSTPFNLLKIANTNGRSGHSAGTPPKLCDWWIRYITKPGQTILDPFAGASTVGVSALANGRKFIGIEENAVYYRKSIERLSQELHKLNLSIEPTKAVPCSNGKGVKDTPAVSGATFNDVPPPDENWNTDDADFDCSARSEEAAKLADAERQLSAAYHKVKQALATVGSLDWEPELLYSTECDEILQFCAQLVDTINQQREKIGQPKSENTKPYLDFLRSL